VLASGILDLLAGDRAAQASVPRQEAKIDEILRRLSQSESVPLDTLRAILASMGEAAGSYNAAEIEQKLAARASEFRDLTRRSATGSRASESTLRARTLTPTLSRRREERPLARTQGLLTAKRFHPY
jgi:hypothetical protein